MATYKLMQDIEAEDKILGPLTLRQFIFGLVAAFFIYLCVFAVTKGVPFLLVLFAPPAIFCGFFAFPFGRDQPTEVWFLAKLRFWFLPRQRVWNQSGVKEMVTITVPKKVERVLTNGLSQNEVKSRLSALAKTIDSRGWAIKNVNVYAQSGMGMGSSADRLIDLSTMPQEVPEDDPSAANDILDPGTSLVAQHMDSMVNQSAQDHRQRLVQQLNAPSQPAPMPAASSSWFMGSQASFPTPQAPAKPTVTKPFVPAPMPAAPADEAALSAQLKKQANSQDLAYSHLRTMNPLGSQPAPVQAKPSHKPTAPKDPAILEWAGNDDLSVETLARQVHKAKTDEDHRIKPDDEVVISLH